MQNSNIKIMIKKGKLLSTFFLVLLLPNMRLTLARSLEPGEKLESEAIKQVVITELMSNSGDGKFAPERMINRAELAAILVKTFNLENREAVKEQKSKTVADVPLSHWAFNHIQAVLKTDIMKGYRGNLFFPNQKVTRAEALAIFAQAHGVFQFSDDTINEILDPHPDAGSIPGWARKAIATVLAEGFVNTDPQNNISPLRPMTHGDMAYVLSKYLQRQQPQPEMPLVTGHTPPPDQANDQ